MLAGAPPASKDPFYPPAQIVCGLVTPAHSRLLRQLNHVSINPWPVAREFKYQNDVQMTTKIHTNFCSDTEGRDKLILHKSAHVYNLKY
jgi:hypothetical protein